MAKLLRLRSFCCSNPFSNSFHQSQSTNIRNNALYVLNCCTTPNHLFQIQANLITSGLFHDLDFSSRLLKHSSNIIRDLWYTYLIFKSIDLPDAFCVNTVIKSFSSRNYHNRAVVFYIEMLRDDNFTPNSFTFPPLVSACAKLRCSNLGQMCHGHAVKYGVDNVLPVQNAFIHYYAISGVTEVAYKLFIEMPIKDLVSWNSIIDSFAKIGEMGLAHKLFDEMPERNVVSWNVMINGYLNFHSPGNALKLIREMMLGGFRSNDSTKVNMVVACGRSNRLNEGRSVHGFLLKESSPNQNLIIDTAMIDMYSKCGRVDVARVIFDRMPRRNIVSWNSMILGHCIHGNPDDGIRLYSTMVENFFESDYIRPDELTFIGILCACARSGTLNDARNYFVQMTDVFHLKPNFAHYWCLANLMAKIGLINEAVDVLRNIPPEEEVSPEYSLWAGVFASSRFLGDVSVGERIAKELIERDPLNFRHYDLLVNVYAVGGRWEEVSWTKEMMKERGIRRVVSCSLKNLSELVNDMDGLK